MMIYTTVYEKVGMMRRTPPMRPCSLLLRSCGPSFRALHGYFFSPFSTVFSTQNLQRAQALLPPMPAPAPALPVNNLLLPA